MIAIYLPTTDHFFQLDLTDTIWTLDYVNTARHIASHEFFQPTVYIIRTVRPWLLFSFGTFDSFLAAHRVESYNIWRRAIYTLPAEMFGGTDFWL